MRGKWTGRGNYQGKGGQGCRRVWGRGRAARWYSYSGDTSIQKGLCSALGIHVFDYNHKAPADQIRATWEKLAHYVGTIHGYDISKELPNKKRWNISKTEHTQDASDEHQLATKRRDQSYKRLAEARRFQKGVYEEQVIEGYPIIVVKAKISLAILNNEIVNQSTLKMNRMIINWQPK